VHPFLEGVSHRELVVKSICARHFCASRSLFFALFVPARIATRSVAGVAFSRLFLLRHHRIQIIKKSAVLLHGADANPDPFG